jgi:hypothetical protein
MVSQKVEKAFFRHSGESRNPVFSGIYNLLDPIFQRSDEFLRNHLLCSENVFVPCPDGSMGTTLPVFWCHYNVRKNFTSFLCQFGPGTAEIPPLSPPFDGQTVSGKIVLEAARQTFLTMLR